MEIARRRDESLDDWCTRVVRECADARRTLHCAQQLHAEGQDGTELNCAEERLEAAQAEVLLAFEAWRRQQPRARPADRAG